MKTLLPLLLALTACVSGNKETSQQDSTAVNDSITLVKSGEGKEVDVKADDYEENTAIVDSSDVTAMYNTYKRKFEDGSANYYEVHISYNLYEASTEVTWLFDNETLATRSFNESWSVEGSEGSTNYFIENDNVVCAEEVDNGETKKWCTGSQGVKLLVIDEDGNTNSEPLSSDFGNSCNQTLKSKMQALLSIMDEGEKTEVDADTYSFRIEKIANYGQDVTETVEVTIPKVVYNELINE